MRSMLFHLLGRPLPDNRICVPYPGSLAARRQCVMKLRVLRPNYVDTNHIRTISPPRIEMSFYRTAPNLQERAWAYIRHSSASSRAALMPSSRSSASPARRERSCLAAHQIRPQFIGAALLALVRLPLFFLVGRIFAHDPCSTTRKMAGKAAFRGPPRRFPHYVQRNVNARLRFT